MRRLQLGSMVMIAGTFALLGGTRSGAAQSTRAATKPAAYDLIITGGRIIDGTGNPWQYGDIAITGDRIVRITPPGLLAKAKAARRIDASGKVVAPGFIDIQAQSVEQFSVGDGRVISSVTQGITTAILGEGATPAPSNDRTIAADAAEKAMKPALEKFRGAHGFNAWLELMHAHGTSQNVGSFLGAATPRVYAKGELQGDATPAELDTIRAVVRNAMEDGAFGIASALIYPPASYESTAELVEQAKAASPYGGVYITHMRSEGDRFLEAVDEALTIGRDGHVPVEIYHLKASGTSNWPKMPIAIAKIDSARAAGQDITADMYLYTAGGTSLASCAPPWAAEGGELLERLQDPESRARIKAEMMGPRRANSENLCTLAGPGAVQIAGLKVPVLTKYEGQRLDKIAAAMNVDWFEAWATLVLVEKAQVGAIFHMMNEANLPLQIRQPWIKWGTDADGVDPDSAGGRIVHPRTYGNFPRLLGRYVREQHVITLEDAIRKGTSAVARRLSIRDRGILQEGYYADVIIFDPATVIDNATFEKPHQISTGMTYVIVNGTPVVDGGKHTGKKPGQVVRGPGWTGWRR